MGELLIVERIMFNIGFLAVQDTPLTHEISVFKLDFNEEKQVQVQTLLGRALFEARQNQY